MLFGKKKLAKINAVTKTRIYNKLDMISSACRISGDAEMIERLNKIRISLNNQPDSMSEDVIVTDYKILRYLEDLSEDVRVHSAGVAKIRLEHIEKTLAERNKFCYDTNTTLATKGSLKYDKLVNKELKKKGKKFKITDLSEQDLKTDALYTDDELLQIEIARQQDKIAELGRKIDELDKQRWNSENENGSIDSDIEILEDSKSAAEDRLNILRDERSKSSLVASMKAMTDAQKRSIARSGISDADMDVAAQAYAAAKQTQTNTREKIDEIRNSRKNGFGSTSAGSAASGASATSEVAAAEGSAARAGRAVPSNPEAEKRALQKHIEQLYRRQQGNNARIDALDEEKKEIDDQLRTLLLNRKTLPKSEWLVYDGKIDQLKSKRNSLITKIKDYTQANAEINDTLAVEENKLSKLGIEVDRGLYERAAGGRERDIAADAMDVRDAAIRNNERKDAASTAAAVADSVEADTRSVSGTAKMESDKPDLNAESKYDDLMDELGISTEE